MNVSDMMLELDDAGFEDSGVTRQVAKIQEAIWELEGLEPWPFLETTADIDTDGTDAPVIPNNIRSVIVLKDLTTGWPLDEVRVDDFEDMVGTNYSQSGDPRFYYWIGPTLHVWPVPPAKVGRLRLRFLQESNPISDSSLEAAILIPRQEHRLIVAGAVAKLALLEDDEELAVSKLEEFDKGVASMREKVWKKSYKPDYVHITEWDYDDGVWPFL